jgi:hypothetical protein
LLNFFTMTEFWDKPAEKSGKVLAAFLEGQPLISALVYEPKCGGGVAGSQPMSTAVHMEPK